MYEHHSQPLLPRPLFIRRMLWHGLTASGLLLAALAVGVLGYHFVEGIPWVDSILNASMILGGMGPVDRMETVAGKLFASAYALFSGVAFLATAGILFVPLAHRLLHLLHLDLPDK